MPANLPLRILNVTLAALSRPFPAAFALVAACLWAVPANAQDSGPGAPEVTESSESPAEAPAVDGSAAPADSSGPGDLVIEVDPKQSRNAHKSLPLAMLFSVALPGTGEYYLEDKGHAKAFLLVEAGFWASLYVSFVAKESYLQSARNYASEYAGINAGGKGEGFLNTMASYRSYQEKQHRQDSYELSQILSGKRDRDYDIPMTPENDWDFGSSSNPQNTRNWKTFQSTLRYYRASKVAVSFAVGALALNRILSLANTLHVYKRTSAKGLSLQVIPEFGPESAGTRLSLRF
jgi:hypothetical protein